MKDKSKKSQQWKSQLMVSVVIAIIVVVAYFAS